MESKIIHGDCIDEMRKFPDESIDLIITDPPYQITACEWDKSFDLDAFWIEVKRIVKPNTAILVFSSQPFTTDLINSNRDWFRYELIWIKTKGGGFANANKKPLKRHENIIVFYQQQPFYNPQKMKAEEDYIDKRKTIKSSKSIAKYMNNAISIRRADDGWRFPTSLIYVNSVWSKNMHPTQKPIELMKYLIKTYSQEGDMVLDCFAGSGSVMKACLETNRQYIMIEKELSYFELMEKSDKTSTSATPTFVSQKEFNKDLTATQQVASPKSASQTSLNPDIKRNKFKEKIAKDEKTNI